MLCFVVAALQSPEAVDLEAKPSAAEENLQFCSQNKAGAY